MIAAAAVAGAFAVGASSVLGIVLFEACPTCPPLVAALVGVRERVGGMRDPDSVVDPAVAERLRARARD